MTALSDLVAPLRNDQLAMIELASSCGVGSTHLAGYSYDVALPVVLQGFSKTVATDSGAAALHEMSLRLSRTERTRPVTLFGVTNHPLGRPVVTEVFGDRLPEAQAGVAGASGLGTAERLIEIVSLVCLASAAGNDESAAGLKAFVASVGAADANAAAVPPPPAPGTEPPTTTPPACASRRHRCSGAGPAAGSARRRRRAAGRSGSRARSGRRNGTSDRSRRRAGSRRAALTCAVVLRCGGCHGAAHRWYRRVGRWRRFG